MPGDLTVDVDPSLDVGTLDADSAPSPVIADADLIVAAVEEDAVFLASVMGKLSAFTAVPYASLDELLASRIDQHPVVVIVLGPSQTDEAALLRFGELVRRRPGLGGILVVDGASANVLRLALRAGVDDAIAINKLDEELAGVVRSLSRRLASAPVTSEPHTLPIASDPSRAGHVVAVFSPKGGVGRSVIAVNLAATLACRAEGPVVLVDLDLQFGDVAVMLHLQPGHGVADLGRVSQLDAELVSSVLTEDIATGAFVLAAPTELSLADGVTPQTIARLLEALRTMAAYVVVDTPPLLDEVILEVLDEADDIALIVGPDIPSLKDARLGLQAIEVVGIPLSRIVVVANRSDVKFALAAARDLERTLRMKVNVALPNDPGVLQSVNTGSCAVIERPRSAFAARVGQLGDLVARRAGARAAG